MNKLDLPGFTIIFVIKDLLLVKMKFDCLSCKDAVFRVKILKQEKTYFTGTKKIVLLQHR